MAGSERRIVTVVFSDLSGFTHFAENMDPEDVTDLLNALFSRVRVIIEREGGTVDKFIGDAVMAVFGAPSAHSDDPVRAVRAGLAIQEVVRVFNQERSLDLKLRIGINTGEALWGSLAGDRATAMGDAVNVAQRLESAARPGFVLVSAAVARATRHAIRFRSVGPVTLKGRTETVETWEAVEERAVSLSVKLPHVGRAAEIARVLEASGMDRGAFFWIHADAGMGKSRLIQEIVARLSKREPATWIGAGRAAEGERAPMSAFADLVRQSAREGAPFEWLLSAMPPADSGGLEPAVAARLVALSAGLPTDGGPMDVEPARLDDETRRAWLALFRNLASARPVVLCLEDLHESDTSSLQVLALLARELTSRPFTVLAESRPGLHPPAGFEDLALGPLLPADSAHLAHLVLGRPASPNLVQIASERSGASPLYLIELLRHLDGEALVEGNPATFAGSAARMPDGLLGVLTARLDALDLDAREALKRASVAGRTFWQSLLESMEPLPPDALDRAAEGDIVVEKRESSIPGEREFEFRNALFRDAAYSLLPRRDRQRLHAVASGWFESAAARGGRRLKRLAASQADAAGEAPRAAALYLEVGREAEEGHCFEEALSAATESVRLGGGSGARLLRCKALCSLDRLMEALLEVEPVVLDPSLTPEQRLQARLIVISSRNRIGRREGLFEYSKEMVRDAPPGRGRARAFREFAELHIGAASYTDAIRTVEQGLAEVNPEDNDPATRGLRALLIETRGRAAFREGRNAESLADLRSAVSLMRESGDENRTGGALSSLASVLRALGQLPESAAASREALELLRRSGNRSAAAAVLNVLGITLRQLGKAQEALEAHQEALAFSRAITLPAHESDALAGMGNALGVLGREGEAKQCELEAADVAIRAGLPASAVTPLGNLLELAILEWDVEGAGRLAKRLEEAARDLKDRRVVLASRRYLANYRSSQGDHEGARLEYEATVAGFREMGRAREEIFSLRGLAAENLTLGRLAEARAAAEEALRISERIGVQRDIAYSLVWVARFSDVEGDAEEALRRADGAVRRAESNSEPGTEARALAERLGLRLESNHSGAIEDTARLSVLMEAGHDPPIVAVLALACAKAGRVADARHWLSRVIPPPPKTRDWEVRRAVARATEARRLLGEGK